MVSGTVVVVSGTVVVVVSGTVVVVVSGTVVVVVSGTVLVVVSGTVVVVVPPPPVVVGVVTTGRVVRVVDDGGFWTGPEARSGPLVRSVLPGSVLGGCTGAFLGWFLESRRDFTRAVTVVVGVVTGAAVVDVVGGCVVVVDRLGASADADVLLAACAPKKPLGSGTR